MARQPNTFITYADAAYMIQYEGFIQKNSFNENSKKLLTRADIENVFANVDKSSFSSYAFKRLVPYKLISAKKGKWRGINPVCEIETVDAFWRGINPVCEIESVPTFWRGINPACEVEDVPTFWRGINPVCEIEEENPPDGDPPTDDPPVPDGYEIASINNTPVNYNACNTSPNINCYAELRYGSLINVYQYPNFEDPFVGSPGFYHIVSVSINRSIEINSDGSVKAQYDSC